MPSFPGAPSFMLAIALWISSMEWQASENPVHDGRSTLVARVGNLVWGCVGGYSRNICEYVLGVGYEVHFVLRLQARSSMN